MVLKRTDHKKAIGPDKVLSELLTRDFAKNLREKLIHKVNEGRAPATCKASHFMALSKVTSEATTIRNTQPIHIGAHTAKVLKKAVLIALHRTKSTMLESGTWQNGFKAERSTQDNLAIIANWKQARKSKTK